MTFTFEQLLTHSTLSRLEARLLLQHVSGFTHAQLIANSLCEASDNIVRGFNDLVKRRQQGEPIAYLVGKREFYQRLFAVSPAVLIPRPDTELLVETALSIGKASKKLAVLELGTGSGIIAITLALEAPTWHITAADLSSDALMVAEDNAKTWGARIRFLEGDWFEAMGSTVSKFDMIVSNPPYIARQDKHLEAGDLRFEPIDALTDHGDGLGCLHAIIAEAPRYLSTNGFLLLEHGQDQKQKVCDALHTRGFHSIHSACDLAGIERVSWGRI